ncbi:hypothetical protein GCM10010191_04700 [Actinomadura vinacea]|uniref:Uncharacterized protein n=1 Tax=Actinomadura vinacea TaxID=115336 RepID=A0ABN3ICD4_9ACTN
MAGSGLDAADTSGTPAGDGQPLAGDVAVPLPDRAAGEPEWVPYAVAQGIAEDEAKTTPKADLVAQYAPAQ